MLNPTPTQKLVMQGKTRKASLQADGKTLIFFRLNTMCKTPKWENARIPTHYKTKADAELAKAAWEANGVYLNRELVRV
jgi:hypothetical protein